MAVSAPPPATTKAVPVDPAVTDGQSSSTSAVDQLASDESGSGEEALANPVAPELSTAAELELQRITYNRPKWITSDALLRDEGVSYGMGLRGAGGLSPTAIEQKLKAIDGWYKVRERVVARRIEQLDERLGKIADQEAESLRLEEEHRAALAAVPEARGLEANPYGQVVLKSVGLGITSLVFGAFLEWWFSAAYATGVAVLVAAAVWLVGQVGTAPSSTYLLTDVGEPDRATWKKLLEEVGFPVVATVLFAVLSYGTLATGLVFATALVCLFVFAYVGRGASRELLRLPQLASVRRNQRQQNKDLSKERERLAELMNGARNKRTMELPAQQTALLNDREALELRLVSIQAESERKQALFLSEYYLTAENPSFGGINN